MGKHVLHTSQHVLCAVSHLSFSGFVTNIDAFERSGFLKVMDAKVIKRVCDVLKVCGNVLPCSTTAIFRRIVFWKISQGILPLDTVHLPLLVCVCVEAIQLQLKGSYGIRHLEFPVLGWSIHAASAFFLSLIEGLVHFGW